MVGTPPPEAAAGSKSPTGGSRRVRSPSRGRSRMRRGGGGEVVVRETIVRETGGGAVSWPILTKTNYTKWAILMRVKMQGAGLWEAIDPSDAPERQERQALGAILSSVPPELVQILAAKDDAKVAWDTIKTLRVGVDRVREARRQKLRKDFDALAFKAGENVEDFSLRVSSVVTELQALGDTTSELDGVQKILRVVPSRYSQMACSIETLLDLKNLSIDELSGRLAASEGRGAPEQDSGGRLLLTEEEWRARLGNRHAGDSSSGGGGKGKKPQGRPQNRDGGGKVDGGGKPPRRNGKCNYCGIDGHWARECRKAQRDRAIQGKREEANLVQAPADDNDGDPTMFMIQEVSLSAAGAAEHVFLNEERAHTVLRRSSDDIDPAWYLDTGASNHMTGDEAAFAELDRGVAGTVRFGDGSLVEIHGRGTVLFAVGGEDHRALTRCTGSLD
ncbi:uncharacterized protein [Aegilops tauschii subsp. strangulata]|uniref:uncharacterized protein n=1 Tax=Aegilops tauschii subsp. strangulata TaxID=200361 RepID=UPI003CC8B060